MPREQRSGVSAMVGLALVVALLLVAGTLAVSGGGILSGGGRIGVETASSPSTKPNGSAGQSSVTSATAKPTNPPSVTDATVTNRLNQVCPPVGGKIRDANRAKWQIRQFLVGSRNNFERITWQLTRRSANNKVPATEVTLEWMDVKEARDTFKLNRLPGQQAIVITFEGDVTNIANQIVDSLYLDKEKVQGIRSVQMFQDSDGTVRTVVGIQRGLCAKLAAPLWKKKGSTKRAKMFLDISAPKS